MTQRQGGQVPSLGALGPLGLPGRTWSHGGQREREGDPPDRWRAAPWPPPAPASEPPHPLRRTGHGALGARLTGTSSSPFMSAGLQAGGPVPGVIQGHSRCLPSGPRRHGPPPRRGPQLWPLLRNKRKSLFTNCPLKFKLPTLASGLACQATRIGG